MSWWQYLLLVNLYLVLFYGFFSLLLRRETFFQLNRIYIVASGLLSFLIPVIQSSWVKSLFITQQVKYILYSHPITIYNFRPAAQQQHITVGQMLLTAYMAVAFILALRLTWQLISLKKIIGQASTQAAFSFFKTIKLSDDLKGRDVIEAHEQVHARQWHSLDVLLIELITIINWFNPVVYFYRRGIKHIHEFIADKQAVNNGTDKSEYALLLLSQTFNMPAHQLVNPFFNHSLLKQRITMLQKRRSNRVALVKYGLSAPLFILMLILSSATINNSKAFRIINRNAEQVFLTPAVNEITIDAPDSAKMDPAVDHSELKQPEIIGDTLKEESNISAAIQAQAEVASAWNNGQVFTSVEESPDFPGGIEKFYSFLAKTLHYPIEMRENNIQGRVVVTFVVEKDGSLSGIKILKDVGYGSGVEAQRAMALSPRWKPGMQNGRLVRVQYTVPVSFTLAQEDLKKDTLLKKSPVVVANYSLTRGQTFQLIDTDKKKNAQPETFRIIDEQPSFIPNSTKPNLGMPSKYFITMANGSEPLYILNGKEIEKSRMAALKSEEILSIYVVKDNTATTLYGDKAANGAIVITTKKQGTITAKN